MLLLLLLLLLLLIIIIVVVIIIICILAPIPAIARGYREFGDCAVFFDQKRDTCDDVTSTTNALDFILRAGPLLSHTAFSVNVTMQQGDCGDDKQVRFHVSQQITLE